MRSDTCDTCAHAHRHAHALGNSRTRAHDARTHSQTIQLWRDTLVVAGKSTHLQLFAWKQSTSLVRESFVVTRVDAQSVGADCFVCAQIHGRVKSPCKRRQSQL